MTLADEEGSESELTDGIHWVGRELEHAVERQATTLEEHVSPVPAIILDNMVRLGLDPEVKRDERKAADPPAETR